VDVGGGSDGEEGVSYAAMPRTGGGLAVPWSMRPQSPERLSLMTTA
jgi:hypothetical protein